MNRAVFILSAGEQKRFGPLPKQLCIVYGQTLMDRQLRQLERNWQIPLLVAWRREILAKHWPAWDTQCPTESILHTMRLTWHLWSDRTIFLLGDVYYPNDVLSDTIDSKAPLRFWMSGSEIFAIAFDATERIRMTQALDYLIAEPNGRKLWNLWRHLIKRDLHVHGVVEENELSGPMLNDGRTFDIDSEDQLKNYP